MIENIEEISANRELESFRQRKSFLQIQVGVEVSRSAKCIAAERPIGSLRRIIDRIESLGGRCRQLGSGERRRIEVRPFADKQIELVTNFASQAVIAIENVRLLTELRARTTDLARSVEELQALGEVSQAVNSTLDIQTVLSTIVTKAVQLSSTEAGAIYTFSGPAGAQGGPAGHAVKPVAQDGARGERSGLAGQDEEGGLEGVLGVGLVAQHGPADVEHHRPVPVQQGVEGGLVLPGVEPPEEFVVSQEFLASHLLG